MNQERTNTVYGLIATLYARGVPLPWLAALPRNVLRHRRVFHGRVGYLRLAQ